MEITIVILIVAIFLVASSNRKWQGKCERYEAILNHEGIVVNGLNNDITKEEDRAI